MKGEIIIKNQTQIELMRKSGRIAADVLQKMKNAAKEGMTTGELNDFAEEIITSRGATPSFKNFGGYPAATCISINAEIVHGIPSQRKFQDGDLVGIDIGVNLNGYHSDTALTFGIGKINEKKQNLIKITELALQKGTKVVKAGVHLGDVQAVIQKTIEDAGYGVIRDLTGHGIGQDLQEPPIIPNFGKKGQGIVLKEGMVIAIEPMVSEGDYHIKVLDDGWTIVTADSSLAAHFEHTLVVTSTGAEILTRA